MNTFFGKVHRVIKKIITEWNADRANGHAELSWPRAMATLCSACRLRKLSRSLTNRKNQLVYAYIRDTYGEIFKAYASASEKASNSVDGQNSPIWVYWSDGVENAPALVQKCVESILRNANGHPVHVLNKENLNEYVHLPEHILEKHRNGDMGQAHFSDVVRVCLLAEHGGLWLDATIYCCKSIPDAYFSEPLFTCKSEREDIGYLSDNQWTTFCLGGQKNRSLFCAIRDFFFAYWLNEGQAMDYVFFDAAIAVARDLIPEVAKQLEDVPLNNLQRDAMIARFADPWKAGCMDDLWGAESVLFKLGYREAYFLNETTPDGKPTVYAAFLNDFNL